MDPKFYDPPYNNPQIGPPHLWQHPYHSNVPVHVPDHRCQRSPNPGEQSLGLQLVSLVIQSKAMGSAWIPKLESHIHMYIHIYIYTSIYLYIYIYIYICNVFKNYTLVYIYIHMHLPYIIYIHIHICMYVYKDIYIYTHIRIPIHGHHRTDQNQNQGRQQTAHGRTRQILGIPGRHGKSWIRRATRSG